MTPFTATISSTALLATDVKNRSPLLSNARSPGEVIPDATVTIAGVAVFPVPLIALVTLKRLDAEITARRFAIQTDRAGVEINQEAAVGE